LTFQLDPDRAIRAKLNQKDQYLGQRSFNSKVTVRTHTLDRLLYLTVPVPLKWSTIMVPPCRHFGIRYRVLTGGK